MDKVNLNYLYVFIFSIITILLRLYNINYDDFWIDEIISFYVSDPDISIKEFFLRHKTLENSPFLFNFILRNYFEIFGYNTDVARFFPALCNIISIFIFSGSISLDNTILLLTSLACANAKGDPLVPIINFSGLLSLLIFRFSNL